MKILYLHQYFGSRESAGATRSFEFARRWMAAGHEVRVITSPANLEDWRQEDHPLFSYRLIGGVPATVVNVPYRAEMSFRARKLVFALFALLACWEVLFRRADVVLATSTPLSIALPGIFAKVVQRIPLVFEVRDLWPEMPIACGAIRRPAMKAAARALEWAAYRFADEVVALSAPIAAAVVERGKPASSVTIIPNCCDLDLFAAPPEGREALGRYGLTLRDGRPLIVYAGALGMINGLGYLLEVAAEMRLVAPEIHFLLVGKGPEAGRIREQARRLGILGSSLSMLPAIPKQEVPAVLAAATVVTSIFLPVPGIEKNSANKFFDGLAAGKPVAINYGGWQAELLQESGAGLVLPADDPAEAARLLAGLVADEQGLARAAAAARVLSQRFDRDLLAGQLEAVLQRAVEDSRRVWQVLRLR